MKTFLQICMWTLIVGFGIQILNSKFLAQIGELIFFSWLVIGLFLAIVRVAGWGYKG